MAAKRENGARGGANGNGAHGHGANGHGANGNGAHGNGANGHGANGKGRGGRSPLPGLSPESPRPVATRPGRDDGGARPRGTLMIIGGHEDKEGDRLILRALAQRVGDGRLVVATVASSVPDELWRDYAPLFDDLGLRDVVHLNVESRLQARQEETLRLLDGATGVFFTGGDQLKITSQLGDSPIYQRIHDIYMTGGVIAGTSAGASVMAETKMVAGAGDESHRIGSQLQMAPGFGLFPGAIIDQHFAERGRIGRLIAAVAQNPRILGVGIDEDTAIVCEPGRCFSVIGAGAVYVVDGADVTYTNLTEEARDRTLSTFDVRLHVLSMGDVYDIASRRPTNASAEEVEAAIVGARADDGEGRAEGDGGGAEDGSAAGAGAGKKGAAGRKRGDRTGASRGRK